MQVSALTSRPELGLTIGCNLYGTGHGDGKDGLLILGIPDLERIYAVSLINCLMPQMGQPGSVEAMRHLQMLAVTSKSLVLHIPAAADVNRVVQNSAFHVIPAYVWINQHTTMNEQMVLDGHAWMSEAERAKAIARRIESLKA